MGSTRKLLMATGIGSGLMYLLDPQGGRRRRAIARDKVTSAGRKTGDVASKAARDLRNRTQGLIARTRSRISPFDVPDEVLHDQIRSRLGRVVSHPSAVEVDVMDGWVTLRGPILADEVDSLLGELSSVRGIRALDDELEVHEDPGNNPSLQGTGTAPRIRSWKRNAWPPALRLAAGSAGSALITAGMGTRNALARIFLGGSGAALLVRSAVNRPWAQITGIGAGRTAVDVRKSIYVDAPVEEVYGFWSNFENLAKFLSNVKEVRPTEKPREYHWTVAGPAGVPVEWDAVVTKLEPNEQIGWKTVSDSIVKNAGRVQFRPENGGTRVEVQMKYNPGAGALGHAAAKLFGSDPKTLMDDDLVRMKTYLETGRPPRDMETSSLGAGEGE